MGLRERIEQISIGAMLYGAADGPARAAVDEDRYKDPVRRLLDREPDAPTDNPVFFRRFARTCLFVAPLLDRCFAPTPGGAPDAPAPPTRGLRGKTILEIGCGLGARTVPLSLAAGRVLACDILPGDVQIARNHARDFDASNIEFRVCNATEIIRSSAIRDCDVVMLYAVLEHTTIRERLEILDAIHENIRPDALVYVGETPNRLAAFDAHSSQLPFYQSLPDELAMRYLRKSPRHEWRDAILNARNSAETMYRRGRGLSFHEFDICFGGLENFARGVLLAQSDPLLLNLYGYRPDEQLLRRRLEIQGVRPADVFSRSWIEFAYRPGESRSPEVGADVIDAASMVAPAKGEDAAGNVVALAAGAHQHVDFTLAGACTVSLGIAHHVSRGGFEVRVDGCPIASFDVERLRRERPEFLVYHGSSFIPLGRIDAGAHRISVHPAGAGSCVGVVVAVTRPTIGGEIPDRPGVEHTQVDVQPSAASRAPAR